MKKSANAHYGRIGGALIIFAAFQLVASVLVAQHIYPNYSLQNNYISDLGVGSTAALFNTSIIAFGIILIVSGILILKSGRKYRAIAFIVAGIGGMCVGLFPETTGLPHIIAATIAFGGVAVSAICFTKVFRGAARYYSLISGLLGIAILALFILGLLGIHISTGLGKGGFEEILFYNEVLWALVTGISMVTRRI
ncbi:MAG TPA: DUF998 domain-containing protein [Candidatus Baltobacteraceae bacterium]|nr:DUF998 domain-containing protein [Candidatus Baltobacteraceae bacterium]